MMNIVITTMSRYSNNTHECPFTVLEKMVMKDFVLSTDMMPKVVPVGDYRIDLEYLKDEAMTERYAFIQTYFNVRGLSLLDPKIG